MPGSRLQVSHSVAFPMKRLVASTDPALPQLHVDLLDTLCLLAFSLADSSWARITPYARYAGGWAGGSGALSLCAPLPFRVGLVRALDHLLGILWSRRTSPSATGRSLRLPDLASISCSARLI